MLYASYDNEKNLQKLTLDGPKLTVNILNWLKINKIDRKLTKLTENLT